MRESPRHLSNAQYRTGSTVARRFLEPNRLVHTTGTGTEKKLTDSHTKGATVIDDSMTKRIVAFAKTAKVTMGERVAACECLNRRLDLAR
jgi:hypothetical protein